MPTEHNTPTPTRKSTKKGEIPKFRPIVQSEFFRRNHITPEEWMDYNEYNMSSLWNHMNTYISDSNMLLLDKCTYPTFCEFVSKNTTLRPECRDECYHSY